MPEAEPWRPQSRKTIFQKSIVYSPKHAKSYLYLAKIYNLEILESNFQDSLNNVTRFLVMQKELKDIDISSKQILTTLVFTVRSIPAALYKCLGGFASNGVNITKLESYIHPQGFDVAQFYIDFEGHPDNPDVKLALEEMKFFCKHLKILGVYEKSKFRKK